MQKNNHFRHFNLMSSGPTDSHCVSDFHVHTAYWIRDRYCQRALMHHSLDMSNISTIHKRWHITTSPLHVIEYQSLVKMMIIPDLGIEALPQFLKQKTTSNYPQNRNECTENTEEEELQQQKTYSAKKPVEEVQCCYGGDS